MMMAAAVAAAAALRWAEGDAGEQCAVGSGRFTGGARARLPEDGDGIDFEG
jgi:hypothetical protein